ncbi:ricin-type beta-trefoil lectin domain protein [Nonomuraea sediminis]|uniref:ricin-type beta-trefoil lectin domain protein n=1 Tax=Nonomuraea sediminis TaxID=2835864 RepID=UPI001BDD1518|nr:ricin-type beta-trefoil lectin domain protein [Nonomuraea sediminis]
MSTQVGVRGRSWRGALLAGLSATLLWTSSSLSPAYAATTYWRFDNYERGCLTAGTSSNAVFEGPCRNSDGAQQWHWVSSSSWNLKLLVNSATGRCLTTDYASGATRANAVWQSSCDEGDKNQKWRFDYLTDGAGYGYLESYWGTQARTSPGSAGSVYTDERIKTDISNGYYAWSASTSG